MRAPGPEAESSATALALGPDLATRMRVAAWFVFACGFPFVLADAVLGTPAFSAVLAVEAAQMTTLLAAIGWLQAAHPERAVRLVALGTTLAVSALTAASASLRGDLVSTCFILVAVAISTGSFLPWGPGIQAVSVAGAMAALAANAIVVPPPDLRAVVFPALGIAVALAGSIWVAFEGDRDRRARRRAASLLADQTQVLEIMARGMALPTVLDTLCGVVEAHTRGMHCSVLRLEGDRLRELAGPSLAPAYRQRIDGLRIGPEVGCFGSAAYLRQTVPTADIASDPRWEALRDDALAQGYRACWSAPILAADGDCLGTFAIYYAEPRRPTPSEERILEAAAHLAGLALARARDESVLARSNARLTEETRVSRALLQVAEGMLSAFDTPRVLRDLCRLAHGLVGCEGAAVVLRDADARNAIMTADTTHGPWAPAGVRLPDRTVRALLAGMEGRSLVRLDADVDDPITGPFWQYVGARRALAAPLRRGYGPEPAGVLLLAARGTDAPFTPLQERIVSGIAKLGSLALENAHLVEQLRTATAAKSQFVSTISHELRTPISVILGYTEMLADDTVAGDERQRLAARVRRTGHELLELIQATLDLSRLEAGRDQLRFEQVAVHELLAEMAADFATMPRETSAVLRWEPGPPVECLSDGRKLRIIVKNLVGNALKFTAQGHVAVRYRVAPGRWELEVEDTGIGIPLEQLSVIFDLFRQGDGSDRRAFGGVGLGLYLVRRLTTQLGGTVRVSSAPGRGSTFTVALPIAAATAVGMPEDATRGDEPASPLDADASAAFAEERDDGVRGSAFPDPAGPTTATAEEAGTLLDAVVAGARADGR